MEQTLTINDQLVELGTLVDNQDTAVQRVGARMIDEFFSSFVSGNADMEITANVLYYLTDIQVRDYALGILDKYTHAEAALKHLLESAPTDTIYINAPATLLATKHYEQGATGNAFLALSNAQKNYSLAILLSRVFKSGWDPSSFGRMRLELHPKVVAGIFGEDN